MTTKSAIQDGYIRRTEIAKLFFTTNIGIAVFFLLGMGLCAMSQPIQEKVGKSEEAGAVQSPHTQSQAQTIIRPSRPRIWVGLGNVAF